MARQNSMWARAREHPSSPPLCSRDAINTDNAEGYSGSAARGHRCRFRQWSDGVAPCFYPYHLWYALDNTEGTEEDPHIGEGQDSVSNL